LPGIRAAILDGDIDKALKHTNAYYPSVLRDNENIYFKLRCRKFIEMIRLCSELNAQVLPHIIPPPPSKRSTASTLNNRDSTTDEYDFEMELDEQLGVHNGAPWGDEEDEEEDGLEAKQRKLQDSTQAMIEYGMELKQEFADDPRREVKRALEDTFALIAYENVRESSLAPLLETSGRVPVAEELNSAILGELPTSWGSPGCTLRSRLTCVRSEFGQVELRRAGAAGAADGGARLRAGRRRRPRRIHQRAEGLFAMTCLNFLVAGVRMYTLRLACIYSGSFFSMLVGLAGLAFVRIGPQGLAWHCPHTGACGRCE
jgi:hypothetical protein